MKYVVGLSSALCFHSRLFRPGETSAGVIFSRHPIHKKPFHTVPTRPLSLNQAESMTTQLAHRFLLSSNKRYASKGRHTSCPGVLRHYRMDTGSGSTAGPRGGSL